MTDSPEIEGRIDELRNHLLELRLVWESVFARRVAHGGESVTFMALSFAARQGDHARSVYVLDRSLDTALIVRSMVEGLSQLIWACQKPDERPFLWRAYGTIRDWRSAKRHARSGTPIPPERQAQLDEDVEKVGSHFITVKAQKAMARGERVDDPYRNAWHGTTVKEMFDAAEGQLLHEHVYGPFSDWHHWDVTAFEWQSEQDAVTMKGRDLLRSATAYTVAFQCLYETLKLLNDLVDVGIGERLKARYDAYRQAFGSAPDA